MRESMMPISFGLPSCERLLRAGLTLLLATVMLSQTYVEAMCFEANIGSPAAVVGGLDLRIVAVHSGIPGGDRSPASAGALVTWAPFEAWELDGFLGNHWVEPDSARVTVHGAAATMQTDAAFSGAIGGGYRLRSATSIGDGFLKPFVSLAYVSHERRGASEAGAFGVGLEFPAKANERASGQLGLAGGIDLSAADGWTVRPEFRVAWSRYISDPSPAVPVFLFGAPVIINDPEPGRDGAVVAFELTGWKKADLQVFAGYTGEFRSEAALHQGRAGFRLNW